MRDPRRASVRLLATLTLAAVAAALPLKHAAQSAPSQAASPNGKIVYQSDQAGDADVYDIYAMDADGKHQTRLTTNVTDDALPVWSPQGDRIAFVSNRRGGNEIYLMNADGSNQRPLRDASPVSSIDFKWSPDGKRMAYVSGGNLNVVEVFTPGGGDSTAAPVSLTAGKVAGTIDTEASWSPDGDRLVVSNSVTNCGGCSDLYIVNADNSARAALVTAPGFDRNPSWSPDGNFIAYDADRGGRGIFVINASGPGTEQRVSGALSNLGGAAWSPDGQRLAFSAGGPVYVVDRDGANPVQAGDLTGTSGVPFWSPDGQKVAFENGGDIHVANADGAGRRVTNYTKSRRASEAASSWQKLPTQ